MLAKCGCMRQARDAFDHLSCPSSISWNILITKHVEYGMSSDAIEIYGKMQRHKCVYQLDMYSLVSLMKACTEQNNLDIGSEIHQHMIEYNLLDTDAFLGSTLVDMYAKCGNMPKAYSVFCELSVRDIVTWTALMNGYVDNNQGAEALECANKMQQDGILQDEFTFSSSLKACSSAGVLHQGQQLHMDLITMGLEGNVIVSSSLVDMYAKNGCVGEALKLFGTASKRNVVTWNALLSGLIEHGHNEMALDCYQKLQNESISPDMVTLICVLQACAEMNLISSGKEVHFLITAKGGDKDISAGNTLLDMYAKCGLFTESKAVFDSLLSKSVASWNALIGGYAGSKQGESALACFRKMQQSGVSPDHISFLHVLRACGDTQAWSELQEIHTALLKKGLEKSIVVVNSLIDALARYGMLVEARKLFDQQATKDTVSWIVLIIGYIEHGYIEEALCLLEKVQKDNIPLDAVAYSCFLRVCASLKLIIRGHEYHVEIILKGLDADTYLSNSLFHMYVKCELFLEAHEMKEKFEVRSTSLWNTLIKGLLDCELYKESLDNVELMHHEATSPDLVTYICSLQSCIHLALIGKGQELHSAIIKKGLDKDVCLASTLVEAYGKWGLLAEACKCFGTISARNTFSWAALMTAYIHCGHAIEVFDCWEYMQYDYVCPDIAMYNCGLTASIMLAALDKGMHLHSELVKRGLEQDCNVGCTLVLMYGKRDLFPEGKYVFDKLSVRTEVTWTVLIANHLEFGNSAEALGCLDQMLKFRQPVCDVILSHGLRGCANAGNITKGYELSMESLKLGVDTNSTVAVSMIDMYAKCGLLLEAQRTFDKVSLPGRSLWAVLITGYTNAGDSQAVFNALDSMSRGGCCPNSVVFLNVIKVCAHAGLVDHGVKYLKFMIESYGILTLEHFSCMIDLFARAGNLEKAMIVSITMPYSPSILVWQTLLGACCKWRNVKLGIFTFELVVELDESKIAPYICISNMYAASFTTEAIT
ncbi:hypothetical protein KP509_28G015100 [Ceratopteris richardii]|nr:hypothetical protein KP509_28G015100 [Ceratopteris richardii]